MSELPITTTVELIPMATLRARSRAAGIAGLIGCGVAWLITVLLAGRWSDGRALFFKSYLVAWLFALGLSLGAMALLMVHHLVGGEWGWFCRRPAEAAAGVLPLLALLFIPVLIGIPHLYPWAGAYQHDPILLHRRPWMNPGGVIARSFLYLLAWIVTAKMLRTLSLAQDRGENLKAEQRLRVVSVAGLIAYFVLMSFASIDWVMSLEPQWYSSIFGFLACTGQAITGMAALVITIHLLDRSQPAAAHPLPRHYNDLATLLMMVVVLWAYHAFAQLLVIWMGNVQAEIPWYLKRSQGAWRLLAGFLIFLGFLAPFLLLLQRTVKQRGQNLLWICVGLLVMRWIDLFWMIMPSGESLHPTFSGLSVLMSVIATAGISGLWIATFLKQLEGAPLLPRHNRLPTLPDDSSRHTDQTKPLDHGPGAPAQPGLA